MIFDTSYSDKKTTRKINLAVGKSFSWKERWKMNGIGSKRMTISSVSEEYKNYMNADHYQSKANIELRPKGIIVHFRHKLQSYSWVMPFKSLTVHYEGFLRLESENRFIQFNDPQNERFIDQMIHFQKTS